jgi:diacylglycerol kinase family enzyme
MRVLVLHNPKAGSDATDAEQLVRHIERCGHQVEVHTSKKAWRTALRHDPDLVVAMGGDGTVGKVARALEGRNIPIALLPMGTANNVATALGLQDRELAGLITGWDDAARRPFDVGVARGPWGEYRFLESVGLGLLSEAIHVIDEGHAAYVNEIGDTETRINAALDVFRHTVQEIPSAGIELWLDGEALSGEYILVEALNFGAAGPNLNFAPHGNPSDGLLDLVLAQEADRMLLRDRLNQLRSEPTSSSGLRTHRGRRIEMRCHGCRLHLDDQLWRGDDRTASTIDITVEAGALTFLIPQDAGATAPTG